MKTQNVNSEIVKKRIEDYYNSENKDFIDLSSLELEEIPDEVYEMIELESIDLSNNHIKYINKSIKKLIKLKILILSGNDFSSIKNCNIYKKLSAITSLVSLDLSYCNIDNSIIDYYFENLEYLNLSNNNIKLVNINYSKIRKLKILDLSCNKISKLGNINNACSLEVLLINDNNINRALNLNLPNLVELNVENNDISSVIFTMKNNKVSKFILSKGKNGD